MKKNNRGFTLVELIASLALLAVILVPVIGFFSNSFKTQKRTTQKASITRVGQFIIENLRNKNYLSKDFGDEEDDEIEVLRNNTETFEGFVTAIRLNDDNTGFSDSNITETRTWFINYGDEEYKINATIKGFNMEDLSNQNVPKKDECDGSVVIDAEGNFSEPYGKNSTFRYYSLNSAEQYLDPIDNNYYPITSLTLVLPEEYSGGEATNLWIDNDYTISESKRGTIRIVKQFKEPLQVYIEGKELSIERGQEGDGATTDQTTIKNLYVGSHFDGSEESSSELQLKMNMTVSRLDDETINDTFEFSFPVDYDYSE